MNLAEKSSREQFEKALSQCSEKDFDGHTDFDRLSAEQRLEWLCQAASFVHEFRGKAQATGAPSAE